MISMNRLEEIQDFLEISPSLFTAGQPFEEQFGLIKESGCAVVINLASQNSPDFVADEAACVRALGMEYIAIPVDWSAPTPADLQAFFNALDTNHGRKIFVHCARNMRVSAFTYLYRVLVLGLDETACRLDMEKIWQPNEVWSIFVAERLSEAGRG
jgi:protein tyrosine phosphatase (PTP) superfamily phosphohydrolase (DUF442 family)